MFNNYIWIIRYNLPRLSFSNWLSHKQYRSINYTDKMATQIKDRILGLQSNLLSFALQLTRNHDDAEDLLQDTTLKVLDNERKFAENTNFKGWVFTIMRNIFINNYRRQVRSAVVVDKTQDLYHLNIVQDSGLETPEGSMSIKEISRVISSFSDDYRRPFSMHMAGYKYTEIAEKMNLPVGTVKSRIFFARKRLRNMLNGYQTND